MRSELSHCIICPRNCGIDRYSERGFCGAPAALMVDLATLHHGEEPPLSGSRGSGTIFFSCCNLRCVYCQNFEISHQGWGSELSVDDLAKMMIQLQEKGAHNINLVTPTHYTPQIIEALKLAKGQGLDIPVVWNSSAYEKVEYLKQLRGLVDIWLPDFKYAFGIYAKKYSFAADYPEVAKAALQEMFSQSGHLVLDGAGIATKGMLVRLLVLPNDLSGTRATLRMLADTFGKELNISIMQQYYPTFRAAEFPELNRKITAREYDEVLETAMELGLENVVIQTESGSHIWTPEFDPRKEKTPEPGFEIGIHNPKLEQST